MGNSNVFLCCSSFLCSPSSDHKAILPYCLLKLRSLTFRTQSVLLQKTLCVFTVFGVRQQFYFYPASTCIFATTLSSFSLTWCHNLMAEFRRLRVDLDTWQRHLCRVVYQNCLTCFQKQLVKICTNIIKHIGGKGHFYSFLSLLRGLGIHLSECVIPSSTRGTIMNYCTCCEEIKSPAK